MTLGQLFKQKRQESGRSLEQLAALTKIHIKILGALEEDSYGSLPARAFTRGFIVNYAKALKLNPDEVLKDHQEFLEQKFSERSDRDKGHQGYVFEGKELEQNRRWLVIGASIALVFAGATLLIFKPQNHKHQEQHKEFEEELDENGKPVSNKPVQMIPFAPIGENQAISSQASVAPTATATANSSVNVPAATPNVAAVVTASATPASTATPVPATPTPAKTPASTPTPAPSATPDPSASPAAKEDKLNKGDSLDPKEVKIKASFQAKEDTYVRYQSDDKPVGILILRKGRYLVIKAKSKLVYEVSKAENLTYKSKAGYVNVTQAKGEVAPDGAISDYSGNAFGSAPLPEAVPLPASH